jgi:hypothetical protein
MGRTVIIRLPQGRPADEAKLDRANLETDLKRTLEAAMRAEVGDMRVVLDRGMTFKIMLAGDWDERKTLLEIFGEVMEIFDSSSYTR